MKRFLLILLGVVAVVALMTAPAPAADFKFGGYFHTLYVNSNNNKDGDDNGNDDLGSFWTRMRLYFTAQASENLMAVAKLEADDVWGRSRIGRVSMDGGSNGRADSGMEIKNIYIQFNMPNTPLTFQVGGLPILLGYGLAFNDDTNGIVAIGKFDPVKVALGYSRLQDNVTALNFTTPLTTGNGINDVLGQVFAPNTNPTSFTSSNNWDLWALDLRYAPTKEAALGLTGTWVKNDTNDVLVTLPAPTGAFTASHMETNLYNVVLDADYKTDQFSVYFTGGKNFGDIKLGSAPAGVQDSYDFTGYLLSAGARVNVQPVVIGLDLYYASGDKRNDTDNEFEDYITPGRDGRFTNMIDDVVFPGMMDTHSPSVGWEGGDRANTTNVRGTGLTATNAQYTPVNIWAVGAHVDFKPLDQTLIQVGAAYMGFVEKVLADATTGKEDDSLGTSVYARLTQGIVDGLTLKVSLGYLFADDGYAPVGNDDDAYRVAAGLFWSW
jgi:hypothetical protein